MYAGLYTSLSLRRRSWGLGALGLGARHTLASRLFWNVIGNEEITSSSMARGNMGQLICFSRNGELSCFLKRTVLFRNRVIAGQVGNAKGEKRDTGFNGFGMGSIDPSNAERAPFYVRRWELKIRTGPVLGWRKPCRF